MAEKKETKTKELKVSKETKTSKETKEVKETKVEAKQSIPQIAPVAPTGNYVYVGKKGAMAYVLAVVTQFGAGAKEVIVKARGKSISRAVDVAEIIKNRDPTMKVVGINTSTEEVVTQEGRPLKVSSIEVVIRK
jgi:DNA-binding protein Alba